MNCSKIHFFVTVLPLAAVFAPGASPAIGQQGQNASRQSASLEPVSLIKDYKSWRKVNPTAVRMQPAAAARCFVLPSQQPNPHLKKYLFVYVNSTGADAMLHQRQPHFAVGSIIVKEKLAKPDSTTPELVTVMVKREKGYNPDSGDWEYLVDDAAGMRAITTSGLKSCQFCHQEYPALASDHVFRDYYLPLSVKRALR
jgi:hypothetical protein